jgi:Sulfatase
MSTRAVLAAPPAPGSALRAAAGLMAGALVLTLASAIGIIATVPWPPGGLPLRLAHHAFDAAQSIGLGMIVAALVGLWLRFVRAPLGVSLAVYALVAGIVMRLTLGRDLLRQALVLWNGRLSDVFFWTFVVLCGLAIPTTHLLGVFFSRYRRLRLVPVVVALGGVVVHHAILRDDYPAVHGAIAWGAATLGGAAVSPMAERWARAWLARRRRRIVLAAAGCAALLGLLVPPSNGVRAELFRQPGAVTAWLLGVLYWSPPPLSREYPPPASPWFADRSGLPPIPASQPRMLGPHPVVVMVTIDALRADVVANPENDARFPHLTLAKRRGAYFTHVTAPGSQTAVSLSTTFSSRYFSQLYWGMHGVGNARFAYPAADKTPRFPELLAENGVITATYCSINFLEGDFGVIRGFTEQRVIAEGRHHAIAKQVVDPALERLEKVGEDESIFLYFHLTEPHAPYDRGADTKGTDFERYLSEVTVADAEIGRVVKLLTRRFRNRWLLIVSADHGEAFGEHGTTFHTKTLYEELVRVPLLIRGAGVSAKRIEQHVGLIDIGPTVLELFGVDVPPGAMGQSLVPLLRGKPMELDRPILAEGRLRRVLYQGDLKVIEDDRRKTVEVFDLRADPGELNNLYGVDPERTEPPVAALRSFFKAHTLPNYTPPFKP